MNQLRVCNPFNNVVASGIANLDLNSLLGTTLECLNLQLGGTFTKSMISSIQLKANGKVIFETTGTNLDLSENFKGYTTADATRLSITFVIAMLSWSRFPDQSVAQTSLKTASCNHRLSW